MKTTVSSSVYGYQKFSILSCYVLHVREKPKISEMPLCKSRFPNERHRLHSRRSSCSNKTPSLKAVNRLAGQEFPRLPQTKWFIFRRGRKIAKSDY
jgi:hypothetical protein